MIKNQVKSQTKGLQAALSNKGTYDTKKLESIFEHCRHDEEKMLKLVRAFCHTYLIDNKSRPFCCERCKLIDFGNWANENHRIEGETVKRYLDEENEDIQ